MKNHLQHFETNFHDRTDIQSKKQKKQEALQGAKDFLEYNTEYDMLGELTQQEIFEKYQNFCQKRGYPHLKFRAFGTKILEFWQKFKQKPVEKRTTPFGQTFFGLRFKRDIPETTFRKVALQLLFLTQETQHQLQKDPDFCYALEKVQIKIHNLQPPAIDSSDLT
jgi:hypothetical protein